MIAYNDVLFEEMSGKGGNLGVITLNRPAVLNSLTLPMIQAMHSKLKEWATAEQIKAVVIRAAEGRAFCAGGDLRSIYDGIRAHKPSMTHFFHDEYLLNRFIFHFPKPYIAFLDGITMGGGVGVSIHGSHRIATDRLLFAMPETGIGFFPDVGGTYFLPRLPGYTGYFLGLTGERIGADDCVALGIAQQKVAQKDLSSILTALAQRFFEQDVNATVTSIIEEFKLPTQSSNLMSHQVFLNDCFAVGDMEEIVRVLDKNKDELSQHMRALLAKKSPTSLKVTLQAMYEGKQLEFDQCMQQEYRLTSRFLAEHDFAEGIRAVIIEKDQKPQWKPNELADVTPTMIKPYFAPLAEELT